MMSAQTIFFTCLAIVLLFNVFYITSNPEMVWNIALGGIIQFVATIIATTILGSINILGSGLSDEGVKVVFGVGAILNILFQINIGNVPVGMGLVMNLFDLFGTEFYGIGYMITSILGLMLLVSGLVMVMK